MKVKTSTLKDRALDWAVATACGHKVEIFRNDICVVKRPPLGPMQEFEPSTQWAEFAPSTQWAEGGPILSRQRINRDFNHNSGLWQAFHGHGIMHTQQHSSELVAGMRCFVASHYGEEVEVPDELVQEMAV